MEEQSRLFAVKSVESTGSVMKLWNRHFAPTQAEVRRVRKSSILATSWGNPYANRGGKELAQRDHWALEGGLQTKTGMLKRAMPLIRER